MGRSYGKYATMVTALVSTCRCIIIITMQITLMSRTIGICVSLTNPHVIPNFSTVLLVFYSTFRGIRAVTYTDVLQFITFAIIMTLLVWFNSVKVG